MIRFGVAGWDYPDWEGIVYPSPLPRGFDRLRFLVDYVDVIEINVTFYRQPDASASASWVRRVRDKPGFRFTAKLFRDLTHGERDHEAMADDLEEAVAAYRIGLLPLVEAGLLGAVLLQFPQRFHDRPEARRHLERLAQLLRGLPLVVEVRHRSWDHDDALRFLHDLGIGFANIDQPALPSTLRPSGHVTSPVAYVRLHGRNAAGWFRTPENRNRYDYFYSEEELRPWAERIGRLADGAEEVFVIANNHYRGKAPANALMLKAMVEQKHVRAPADLVRTHRDLAPLATAEGRARPVQGTLFD
jgi:uncharacterized protein YecE (DUF72 family)